MRIVSSSAVKDKVKELFIKANHILPDNVKSALGAAADREESLLAKSVIKRLSENIDTAKQCDVPVCQDTGMAVLFIDMGKDVHIQGDSLDVAVNKGVREAYLEGKMRCSVVEDPFFNRKNTDDNTPAIIYTNFSDGDKIKITALPKGFGSENMSALKMFTPSATREDIISFVVDTVKKAGSNPCPPIVVGIGMGGTFDYSCVLSKKALARELDDVNPKKEYAELEAELLEKINRLDIGPQGFGGKTTALAVKIESYPTHIAGLPVAVNICCHVARHLTAEI
ncbi:MAG: fumarate hydratase [Clostridia bacterium]|nr:fumarate hydratase [Clostridia bacterium]